MQKISTLIVLIAIITLSSCRFNQSVKKDLITGAYSRGDGIGVDAITIEINGETDNKNKFVYGQNVSLVFNNVTGLTNSNGKTFPKLLLYVLKNEKDTVLYNPNLLKSLTNGTEASPLRLKANFRTALPHQSNEKYQVFIEITDKKGDGKFNYELPFVVKENDLLDVKSKGIDYSNIYLWNETLKQPVLDSNVSSEHLFILILNDIEGLELVKEKVFPIFSLNLTDNKGKKIISDPNLLSAYDEVGVSPKELKNQVTAKLTFTKGAINNPYKLSAILKDKNSTKEIYISTELYIN
ncbi:hypothetical protein [Pseudozobellia sp. WGM2]|uniref:hypothetical protein n=1 Tax=Pseudozobellia sp. WGM2 TaxID=2787625 RepID=UPI001AE0AD61|nr:hypothetical protein [Pseudozobellia sp. WGM2]